MITLTVQDADDQMTFGATLITPIVLSPVISEADVTTLDGNISTYYGYTKRQYEIKLMAMDQESYSSLKGFVERQYQNLKYPSITIGGADTINVVDMTAKMTISDTEVINACGLVDGISLIFRESKQMP